MSLIRPFAALRPIPSRVADVAAPPYDVLTVEEARERAEGMPWSFLHVSRPEIDLPPDTDPYDPAVYAKGAENFSRMMGEGILQQDEAPFYYLYRLSVGTHVQTGLVAAASVHAYDNNRIRRHELTRPAKETDRVRQIDAVNAQTGPVFMTYRQVPTVDEIVAQATEGVPEFDFATADGVRHSLWVVRDRRQIEFLSEKFEAIDGLYIADGHHRCAAASRVAAMRGRVAAEKKAVSSTGEESYNYFLAVIFPHNQVRILDYNRVVVDLNGLSRGAFLQHVAERFRVEPSDQAVRPSARGQFGMYLPGQWYRLTLPPEHILKDDAIARLDVSLLTDQLLEPVLGIGDLRRDERIDFIGGSRGVGALEEQVNTGRMAVAFSLYPTRMQDLLAVADQGLLMPPKSTWFEPKLADGLVSHLLD